MLNMGSTPRAINKGNQRTGGPLWDRDRLGRPSSQQRFHPHPYPISRSQ
jgi:hypothetical protein